jgi:hypothetical protein
MNNLVEERKPAVKGRTQGELPRDVSNLVNKTFQGIRAVYAVWSTASGKEQDRDKDTFPRLLELVNSSGSKLFTPKQVREVRIDGNKNFSPPHWWMKTIFLMCSA